MDKALHHPDAAAREHADGLLAILTPIVKGFVTDMSLECTNLAIQVHGGHGYVRETGVEQYFRDARITAIYEGTNGIQALDLLGRKVLGIGWRAGATAGGHDRRFLRAPCAVGGTFRIRHAPDRTAEGMERSDREHRGTRGPRSGRNGRSRHGLPAVHGLPVPGAGAGRGARPWRSRPCTRALPMRRSTRRSSRRRDSTSPASCRAPRRTSTRSAPVQSP